MTIVRLHELVREYSKLFGVVGAVRRQRSLSVVDVNLGTSRLVYKKVGSGLQPANRRILSVRVIMADVPSGTRTFL